jgi:hypothetical protein
MFLLDSFRDAIWAHPCSVSLSLPFLLPLSSWEVASADLFGTKISERKFKQYILFRTVINKFKYKFNAQKFINVKLKLLISYFQKVMKTDASYEMLFFQKKNY